MNIQLIQIPHDTYHDILYSFPGQSVTVGVSLYVLCLTSMSEVDMVIMKISHSNVWIPRKETAEWGFLK